MIILLEYQGQNFNTRIGRKEWKQPHTPALPFINVSFERKALQLLFNFQVCVASVELVIASENVATPAKKEIACSMMGAKALVYSRERFVHCTRVVVVLNEGMGWVK